MPVEHPKSGRLGHLTKEQEDGLAQFRRELVQAAVFDPQRHTDHLLLRFLRARRFDLPKAKAMLLACEQWRAEYGVAALAKHFDFPEAAQIRALYPQYYHKTDKLGRPIYIEHLGNLDVKKLTAITTMERMQQRLVHEYEKSDNYRFPACSMRAKHHIEQSCTILDLSGVSLMSFSQVAGFVKQVSKIGQDYYPEVLGTMFIINAPMLFSSVWSLIKPFLDEVTVKKIHILGGSYKKALLEYIDEENLPSRLGGKCTCPGGCENGDQGPWTEIPAAEIDKLHAESAAKLTRLRDSIVAEIKAAGGTIAAAPAYTVVVKEEEVKIQ